jgi:hypothetical protein
MRRLLLLVAVGLSGCSGLRAQLIDSSVQKPSNVAVYFTVDTAAGKPVPGLTAESFRIYEDGKIVSAFESKQTILNPQVSATHVTLLLVDLSASVTKSGEVSELQGAVDRFTSKVGALQETAVYAFDGRPDLIPLRNFSSGGGGVNVNAFSTKDPSTNLNGAIIKGVDVLKKQLEKATTPLRFGTMVIFTDGTDHAARASHSDAVNAINDSGFDTFVIGVGAEIDEQELKSFTRYEPALSKDPSAIGLQFDRISETIEGYSKRFYLLSYCSPARAGQHTVTIEPFTGDLTGRLSYDFDATGFGPECDPNRKPAFDVKHPGKRVVVKKQ